MTDIFSLLETIAFTFLCSLIRSYVPNNQLMLIILLVFIYVIIFREFNKNNS